MTDISGTFVGGTSTGWSIDDPNANAVALGYVPDAPAYTVPAGTDVYTPTTAPIANYVGGVNIFGDPAGGGVPVGTQPVVNGGQSAYYDPYTAATGGGMVGGSWSPEPNMYSLNQVSMVQPQTPATTAGQGQILYGHFIPPAGTSGAPQAASGQGTLTSAADVAKAAAAAKADADKQAAEAQKPAEAPPAEQPKPEEPKKVVVKPGDSLSKIAKANGMDWHKLYELNKDVVGGDPNMILPGQELKLS